MPANFYEWLGFGCVLINAVLVAGFILCMVVSFLEPFFTEAHTWRKRRDGR